MSCAQLTWQQRHQRRWPLAISIAIAITIAAAVAAAAVATTVTFTYFSISISVAATLPTTATVSSSIAAAIRVEWLLPDTPDRVLWPARGAVHTLHDEQRLPW